jgi:MoxR-like ATPase
MQEHHVSVGGQRYDLPKPFHVLATQNPIEQEGTYPLPEAQLDRFPPADRCRLPGPRGRAPHPDGDDGRRGASRERGDERRGLMAAQRLIRRLPVGESVVEPSSIWCARRVPARALRDHRQAALGPGPARQPGADARGAGQGAARGRLAPSIDDVRALAEPVLKHRMALTFAARADGETISGVIERLTAQLDRAG